MTDSMRHLLLGVFGTVCISLSACSGGGSAPRPAQPAPAPAELVDGDLHIRASTVATMQLPESVARGYGITRAEHRILLLVAMRTGPEGDESALTGSVQVQATDLQGRTQDIPMRELRTTGELVDYIGTLEVTPPETLRFKVTAAPANDRVRRLEFVREFPP